MKLKGISDKGLRRLAQAIDEPSLSGPDADLRRQLNSIIETLVDFREQFDDDYLTELGRDTGETAARAFVEAVWPALPEIYAFLENGAE